MKSFRFSPIKTQAELLRAIKHVHFKSFELCKQKLGYILPVAGNIGIFCHDDDEFNFLTKMREELTDSSDNWNKKYFRLYQPIVISAENNIPKTTYTYLYIRKNDIEHNQVGDLDFYMEPSRYKKLKRSLLSGKEIEGLKILDRSDLDLIEVFDPTVDVVAFIGQKTMTENVKF
ncbi:MAG: hypothetical protein ACOZAK_03665 [Patescibacteria group bacterium]